MVDLIRLRYKLLWAKVRSRNGRIALFLVGYLLLVLVVALLAAGGFGAGMAAVRLGKAELVARLVLGSLFVQATLATVVMGFGISAVFSETELRRYPLTALQRRLARHITGVVDPFWFLVLALDLGLVVGLYAMGAAGFWMGLISVLVLLVANYLLARVVALAVERMVNRKGGSLLLMVAIIALSVLPGTLASALRKNPALGDRILAVLQWTPPFGAAAAMTADGASAFYGLALVAGWIAALAAAVVALERRPPERQQAAVQGPISWSSPYERVASLFGAEYAPLVGHWLRFYVRNTRFRTTYLLTLPLAGFLTYQMGTAGQHPIGLFAAALGTFPMCGFLCTSRIAVNLFGYTSGAFRRFFLLPTEPVVTLRAASFASVLLAASTVLLATVAWVAISPVPWDARRLAMLVASGVTGLFGLHAAGLWTTLYGPRRGNYNSSMGNDMSAAGNVTVIGGLLGAMLAPQILARRAPALLSPENWWAAMAVAAAAVAFYFISLRMTGALFTGRRERLMAVVEGRA
jgi:hypothetical protein